MPAHRHGHRGSRAAPALWAVKRRSQTLTPPQQQLPGAEVTRHRRGAALHHASVPVAMAVVGAAERATEQTFSSLPPVAVDRKYKHINSSMILE